MECDCPQVVMPSQFLLIPNRSSHIANFEDSRTDKTRLQKQGTRETCLFKSRLQSSHIYHLFPEAGRSSESSCWTTILLIHLINLRHICIFQVPRGNTPRRLMKAPLVGVQGRWRIGLGITVAGGFGSPPAASSALGTSSHQLPLHMNEDN